MLQIVAHILIFLNYLQKKKQKRKRIRSEDIVRTGDLIHMKKFIFHSLIHS